MSTSLLQSLESRLNSLQDFHKNTQLLIKKLSTSSFDTDLTSEIHERLKQADEELEILEVDLDSISSYQPHTSNQQSERERHLSTIKIHVDRLKEDFKHDRSRFHTAQLSSKRASKLAKADLRRQQLLSTTSSSTTRPRTPKPSAQRDETVTASNDVTAALRRTQYLLQTEVSRSQYAKEVLDEQNESLKELGKSYSDVDSLLASSKSLVGTLLTSTKSDTWYLETAVYILLATLGWLVFRRILWHPFWLFVWWPGSLLYRLVILVLGVFGAVGINNQKGLNVSGTSTVLSGSETILSMSSLPPNAGAPGKIPKDQNKSKSLVDKIGKQIEEGIVDDKEVNNVRGDGTPLVHSDAPRNPKKKVFEEIPAPTAGEKKEKEKDEL